MKKIFTLISMALIAMTSQAQNNDLQFCYENGTIIPDGSVVVVDTPDPELLAEDEIKFESGIFIKNNTASSLASTLEFSVTEITEESELSVCLGTNCHMYTQNGTFSLTDNLAAGSISSMQCHWSPAYNWDTDEYIYGNCKGTYSIKNGSTVCSTITVNFVYADPAGISTIDKNATVVKSYDLQGRETSNAKGIVIEKMSDGSVRKVIK